MRIEFKVGLEETAKKAVRDQLEDIAKEILSDAQRTVPVRTGNLKRSGSVEMTSRDTAIVGYRAEYATYVSEGTSRQAPNPWFKASLHRPRGRR